MSGRPWSNSRQLAGGDFHLVRVAGRDGCEAEPPGSGGSVRGGPIATGRGGAPALFRRCASVARVPVSFDHEALISLFRNRPELAPELLRDALHVAVPNYAEARVESADLTDIKPAELRADLVVLLLDGRPVLAIVVEVQLSTNPRKRFTWPAYVAGVRARFECDACVLVFAPSESVANWAGQPIELGPGAHLEPWVVGPRSVPVIREPARAAEMPELAVLSVMAHGGESEVGTAVAFAAASAASRLDDERAALYWDLIQASLNDATRAALEDIMRSGRYEYQSDFAKKYYAEGEAKGKAEGKVEGEAKGKAEGRAEGILAVLTARGVAVTDHERRRVLACSDLALLDRWLKRSVTAVSANEVFTD